MTPEQLDEIEARANQAADHVAMLCTKEERWRMSVPPKDSDSDLMLLRSLEKDVPALVAEVRRLRAQVEALEKLHRDDGRGNCEVCMDFVTQVPLRHHPNSRRKR